MTTQFIEEAVVKLTRLAHPTDQGTATSALEDALRQKLTEAVEIGREEGERSRDQEVFEASSKLQ